MQNERRLLCGPGLFGAAITGAYILLLSATGRFFDDAPMGGISALGILTDLVLQFGRLFTTTLAVIVLCDGYRRLAHIPELGASGHAPDLGTLPSG